MSFKDKRMRTAIFGSISSNGVEWQVGSNVSGADDRHMQPKSFHLGPEAVEVRLCGMLGGRV